MTTELLENEATSAPLADELTAEVVAEYLHDNPDFFHYRRELLDRLALTHHEQGAVSLVQVQMGRQRQRIEELEEEITQLMSLAANNDRTFNDFMELQETVLKCTSVMGVIGAVEAKARDLGLRSYVRLIEHEKEHVSISKEVWARFSTNHLNGKESYLGRLRKVDRESLFKDQRAPEMGSYVILPLIKQGESLGILAFSSEDGGHFQPSMDTLFLHHLSLVVSHLIYTLSWQDNEQCLKCSTAN
ncbi:DUF484 family protein [Vibrio maerlii]|uniref:DUF484 family protein n=1 Tax=Vibrio maerlii TaxID=2231648 RepID=UPI000E3B5EFE|nr:DUF484 family protein [Vibrio maerlii]